VIAMHRASHSTSHACLSGIGAHADKPIALTEREQEVLGWVAQGKSSWEIGHIILCKECTVNFHCRNIMGKLQVSTRGQALFKAISLGLINPAGMADRGH
jgi:DNA-binding CsgD family transcriptional regulator